MPTADRASAASDPTPLRLIAQAVEEEDALATTLTRVLTERLLGEPPARWLSRDPEALRRWCAEAATAPTRRLAETLRDPDPAVGRTRLLPALSAWIRGMDRGSAARLLARLVELARLPARLVGDGLAVVRAWSLGEGVGVAGVETSRGLLLHIVRLDAGRVTDYRILAPTEWNFHPAGPLAEALAAMPPGAGLAERARRVVASLDPCVACQVEIRHA